MAFYITNIAWFRDYYGFKGMPGFSLPGAEHSTITSWTKEREVDAYRIMLTKVRIFVIMSS